MNRKKMVGSSSTKIWIAIYVVFPLLPFFLAGVIRSCVMSWSLTYTTFSASELAICLALAGVLANQSLVRSERVLDNEDKRQDTELKALLILLWPIIFLILFGIITGFRIAVEELNVQVLKGALDSLHLLVFVLTPFMLIHIIRIQQSFGLEARL